MEQTSREDLAALIPETVVQLTFPAVMDEPESSVGWTISNDDMCVGMVHADETGIEWEI